MFCVQKKYKINKMYKLWHNIHNHRTYILTPHLKSSYDSFTKMGSNIYISHIHITHMMCIDCFFSFFFILYILSSLLKNVSLILMVFLRETIKDLDTEKKVRKHCCVLTELQLMRVAMMRDVGSSTCYI